MKQKGMEMAIQIFIVLFVLLAVAMLVLQLVSQQFKEQGTKIQEEQDKAAFENKISSGKTECSRLCATGDADSLAQFCIKAFDFRLKQGALASYNNTGFKAGVGVCDDRIYCNLLTSCGSSSTNMGSCKTLLCNYWKKDGKTAEEATELLRQFVRPGECYAGLTDDEKKFHWYYTAFDKADGDGELDAGCS